MKRIILSVIFILFWLPCLVVSGAAENDSIVILTNKGIKQYDQAIEGFKQVLAEKNYSISYTLIDENDSTKSKEALLKSLSDKPKLILAVGTEKALLAKSNVADIPVLFTMVLDPVESGIVSSFLPSEKNIVGVSLKISIEKQFDVLHQILPQAMKVAMLYDVKSKTAIKNEAELAAQKFGLELLTKPVDSKSDVTNALDEVMSEADCLWAGVDPFVYNAQSSKHILLTTLRYRIPFMAFSSHYVNAGALMALESDYEDIGRQSAELGIKILEGQNPGSLQIETPRKVKLLTNQNTANVIGVTIPQEYLN